MEFNPEALLSVNPDDLEGEFKKQAVNFFMVHKALIRAQKTLEESLEILSVNTAETAKILRGTMSGKITEKRLEEELLLDNDLQNLRKIVIENRAKKDIMFGLIRALEHKKNALTALGFASKGEL
jgi:hypothetical protein